MKAPVTGSGDRTYENPPPGTYLAACNGVYMLGTQPGYNGGAPNVQVMLSFQLFKRKGPVRDSAGRIFEISRIMNHTANVKSNLTDYAGALRGAAYTEDELAAIQKEGGLDPEICLGLACKLNVIHEKKGDATKAKIKSVAALDPEDDVAPVVDGDETYWDWTIGDQCPKRIEYFWKRATENPDRDQQPVGAGVGTSFDALSTDEDDIPF